MKHIKLYEDIDFDWDEDIQDEEDTLMSLYKSASRRNELVGRKVIVYNNRPKSEAIITHVWDEGIVVKWPDSHISRHSPYQLELI